MATVEQVIKHLLERIDALESRVAALEAASTPAEWNAEIGIDLPQPEDDLDNLDPGERQAALAARARLARDTGTEQEESLEPPQVQVELSDDGTTAWFPVATEYQEQIRGAIIDDIGLEELKTLDHETAVDAWLKGGPLWLHAYNREHVMSLPIPIKQTFVADAMISSNRDGHELARDILKDVSPGDPEATVDNLMNMLG